MKIVGTFIIALLSLCLLFVAGMIGLTMVTAIDKKDIIVTTFCVGGFTYICYVAQDIYKLAVDVWTR